MEEGTLAPCLSPGRCVVIFQNPWLLGLGMIVLDGTVFIAYKIHF
jgi:hypothetical protein